VIEIHKLEVEALRAESLAEAAERRKPING
jgi:hypothetical protein